MLTPYDIETKTFSKKMRGYDPEEVSEFIELVLQDYEKIYKENSNLKSKMSVLVDKIEEYKNIEDSLRNALVSAQKMGENMIKEANTKSELILSEAGVKAERLINSLNVQVYKEKQKLEEAKREAQLFKSKLLGMYKTQINLLESLPGLDDPSKNSERSERIDKTQSQAISQNSQNSKEENTETANDCEQKNEKDEEDQSVKDLKFGLEYGNVGDKFTDDEDDKVEKKKSFFSFDKD